MKLVITIDEDRVDEVLKNVERVRPRPLPKPTEDVPEPEPELTREAWTALLLQTWIDGVVHTGRCMAGEIRPQAPVEGMCSVTVSTTTPLEVVAERFDDAPDPDDPGELDAWEGGDAEELAPGDPADWPPDEPEAV